MAEAMKLAVKAGRLSYKAGLMLPKKYAIPSSPIIDQIA
jgi:thiazole synthase ThiGH ThiG subunit